MASTAPDKRTRSTPIFSAILDGGGVAEMLYRPVDGTTCLCVFDGADVREEASIEVKGSRLVPYAPSNNLLRHGVVLLPSGPEEYGSAAALVADVRAFVHRHVDVSPVFETLAAYYVLLTWIYDGFNELPYLRVRGEPGSGKTRFLQTVGSICYKPIFASGASTVSPIFRILDIVQGTLVMDEGDFSRSDEKAELVKILNNGNARGFPVLRSELVDRREYDPRAYTVFGPKLVATRGYFEDKALESRFLTEDMGRGRMRSDIPVTLPPEAERDAHLDEIHVLGVLLRDRGELAVERQVVADEGPIAGEKPQRERLVVAVAEYEGETDALMLDRHLHEPEEAHAVIRDGIFIAHDLKTAVGQGFQECFDDGSVRDGNVGRRGIGRRQLGQILPADEARASVDNESLHDVFSDSVVEVRDGRRHALPPAGGECSPRDQGGLPAGGKERENYGRGAVGPRGRRVLSVRFRMRTATKPPNHPQLSIRDGA